MHHQVICHPTVACNTDRCARFAFCRRNGDEVLAAVNRALPHSAPCNLSISGLVSRSISPFVSYTSNGYVPQSPSECRGHKHMIHKAYCRGSLLLGSCPNAANFPPAFCPWSCCWDACACALKPCWLPCCGINGRALAFICPMYCCCW